MKKIGLLLYGCFLLLGLAQYAGAQQADAVYKVVSSEQLKAMIDAQTPDLIMIDTRSAEEYQEAHIKGAISIPWMTLEKDPALLNTYPKHSRLAFYCTGLA
ncbi:MAG TPA: rhodanese-like domain-containing protein [Desulfuromonadaceae bacterium]|jgi:predicted sulfurtransferase